MNPLDDWDDAYIAWSNYNIDLSVECCDEFRPAETVTGMAYGVSLTFAGSGLIGYDGLRIRSGVVILNDGRLMFIFVDQAEEELSQDEKEALVTAALEAVNKQVKPYTKYTIQPERLRQHCSAGVWAILLQRLGVSDD